VFTHDDLARLRQIHRLVEERGVNLAGVDIALTVTDRLRALRAALAGSPDFVAVELGAAMDDLLLTLLAAAKDGCRPSNNLEDSSD
jgi:MerR family transcriptional regulator/heat shock protein HspR